MFKNKKYYSNYIANYYNRGKIYYLIYRKKERRIALENLNIMNNKNLIKSKTL